MATTADEHGVALVTGGAVRVGREISLTLARAGFAVAINYRRSRDAAEHLVGELRDAGCAAAAFQADITRHDEVEALVERVEADLGPTAVLVNNAATFERRPYLEVEEVLWRRNVRLNLEAPLWLGQRVGRLMWERGSGRIVNICGTVGIDPPGDYVSYCVTKSALDTLTRCMAAALAPRVQVNGVAPGAVLFPDGTAEEERARVLRRVPAGRAGSPADVAATVLFLATGPDYITGVILPVDGGAGLTNV